MAIRINPDGSITVGILPEENKQESKAVEQTAETPKKKSTKKSK